MNILVRINNFCLFLLVFSVTFEQWDPFKLVGSYSVTYFASVVYIASWIPLFKSNFNFVLFKKYVVPLLMFILAGFVATAFHSEYSLELKDSYNYRVLLLIILMFLISMHYAKDESMLSKTLNVYIASVKLMFLLFQMGTGVEIVNNRLRLFGDNPNAIGMKAVIAFLIILANLLKPKNSLINVVISLALFIPLLSLIIASGSRGAFLSVFMGISIITLFSKMSLGKKIFITISGLIASVFFFIYVLETNEVFRRRLLHSLETGDIGRNEAWMGAYEIIQNNLILGVGFPGALPEMYKYIGIAMDPHNVFLYVLITTGVIGFLFYMLFVLNLAKNLVKTYQKTGRIIYVLIFVILMINMAKAGGAIGTILYWFLFAVLIGSTFSVKKLKYKFG